MTCASAEIGTGVAANLNDGEDFLLDSFDDNALFLSIFEDEESNSTEDLRDRSTSEEDRSVSSSWSLDALIPAAPQVGCVPMHVYPVAQAVQYNPATVMMNLCSTAAMAGKRVLSSTGSSTSTDDDEETVKRQRKEVRLMKNREAANRSRIKKKHAMDALEAQVEDLNQQLSSLQQDLAASRAECNALREQNDFLKTLVRIPGTEPSTASGTPALYTHSSSYTSGGVSSGVMVLAVVCAFTFASDWFMFSPPSTSGTSGASSGYAANASVRGGRVLLSMDEHEGFGDQSVANWNLACMDWLARVLIYAGGMCIVYVLRQAVLGNTKQLLPC